MVLREEEGQDGVEVVSLGSREQLPVFKSHCHSHVT